MALGRMFKEGKRAQETREPASHPKVPQEALSPAHFCDLFSFTNNHSCFSLKSYTFMKHFLASFKQFRRPKNLKEPEYKEEREDCKDIKPVLPSEVLYVLDPLILEEKVKHEHTNNKDVKSVKEVMILVAKPAEPDLDNYDKDEKYKKIRYNKVNCNFDFVKIFRHKTSLTRI